ncbi:transposase [Ahrensia kielensis]|uniref:transposase n=1 Tax=Ahrensia kielensis TaxID=76980 RepID=UPI00039E9CDA|nr:transposase [Ahrensia kielensis]
MVKPFWFFFAKEAREHLAGIHSNWRWHIDEALVKINSERLYLWRDIDHKGTVLESYVSKRRDRRAALKVLRKLLSKYGSPVEIVTDKLGSCGAAMQDLGIRHGYETGKYKNNHVESSHLYF